MRFLKSCVILFRWVVCLTELQITLDVTSIHLYSAISETLFTEIPLVLGNKTVEVITMGSRPIYHNRSLTSFTQATIYHSLVVRPSKIVLQWGHCDLNAGHKTPSLVGYQATLWPRSAL
jgi:hypothetical protein